MLLLAGLHFGKSVSLPQTPTPSTFLSPGALAALSSDLLRKETQFLTLQLDCVAVFNLMPENSRAAGPCLLFWTVSPIFHLSQGLRQICYRNARPSSSCSQWKKRNCLEWELEWDLKQ